VDVPKRVLNLEHRAAGCEENADHRQLGGQSTHGSQRERNRRVFPSARAAGSSRLKACSLSKALKLLVTA
jgi:hypothetical protein